MKIQFPNSSRSYSSARQCVRFRGYDAVFEIAFDLDERALQRLSPGAVNDEASFLEIFDRFRDRIERVASAAYSRKRRTSLLWLSAADF
ncbi:MAG: DUF1488 family protein [Pseudomonadota bacterium]